MERTKAFCSAYSSTCATHSSPWPQCISSAKALARGVPGTFNGHSLSCREAHLRYAVDGLYGGAQVHCTHASLDGGNVCVDASNEEGESAGEGEGESQGESSAETSGTGEGGGEGEGEMSAEANGEGEGEGEGVCMCQIHWP